MPTATVDSVLMAFFFSHIPEDLLGAYRKLASLKYPIPDRKTLIELLENPQASEDEKYANGILLDVLDVSAFPLASGQNALEKFHSLLPPILRIVPLKGALPLDFDVLAPDFGRRIETNPPEHENKLRKFVTCSQRCEDAFNNCMREVSPYDERGRWRCLVGLTLCMMRCRRT